MRIVRPRGWGGAGVGGGGVEEEANQTSSLDKCEMSRHTHFAQNYILLI